MIITFDYISDNKTKQQAAADKTAVSAEPIHNFLFHFLYLTIDN
jgi:hypothetical protein